MVVYRFTVRSSLVVLQEKAIGATFKGSDFSYTERDVILYALGSKLFSMGKHVYGRKTGRVA